jgi:hypothetical protein
LNGISSGKELGWSKEYGRAELETKITGPRAVENKLGRGEDASRTVMPEKQELG